MTPFDIPAVILLIILIVLFFSIPDQPKKSTRPSPDFDTTHAAGAWRKAKGTGNNQAVSANDVPSGELWARTDCNQPPVDVRFIPKNQPKEWKNAYTKWGDEREY
jgi:hypothetical protein